MGIIKNGERIISKIIKPTIVVENLLLKNATKAPIKTTIIKDIGTGAYPLKKLKTLLKCGQILFLIYASSLIVMPLFFNKDCHPLKYIIGEYINNVIKAITTNKSIRFSKDFQLCLHKKTIEKIILTGKKLYRKDGIDKNPNTALDTKSIEYFLVDCN